MARIYFIHSGIYSCYDAERFHYGIAIISSVLKRGGHQTQLSLVGEYKQIGHILKELEGFRPDIVAFASVSSQFRHVQRIASEIKKYFSVMTICGGVHTTLVPDCLEESKGLDAIVRGEGEYPLLELADAIDSGEERLDIKNIWFKKDGKIIKNELRPLISDLDSLPFMDRDLFNHQKSIDARNGIAEFMLSRGCPFKCSFCCNHTLSETYKGKGKYLRIRGVENALEEIGEVTSKYRVKSLAFGDDSFNVDKEWFVSFLTEYKKRIKYPFKCQLRPGISTRDMFQLLKEAGCTVIGMGIESGNPRILSEVMNRKVTVEQTEEAFRYAHEAGLKTSAGSIIGVPSEDVGTIKDTIRLNTRINPTSAVVGIFYPYIGTDLRKYCEEEGFTIKDASGKFVERRDVALELPTIKSKDILYYARNFRYLVYKGKYPWVALSYKIHDDPKLALLWVLLRIFMALVPSRLRIKIFIAGKG